MSPGLRRFAGTAARTLAQLVPDPLLVGLLPRSLRWDPAALRVAIAPETPVRLYIAPANSAGQSFRWARAVEAALPGVGAVCLMTTDDATAAYDFDADVSVPASAFVFAGSWRRRQRRALEGFTHALVESGRFPYGSVPGSDPRRVIDGLAREGVRVGLLWHGSDIRVPSRHALSEPDSPFGPRGDYPPRSVAILESNALAHRRLIAETTSPVFVSTPGLLDVDRSTWLPVVVDPARWTGGEPVLSRARPVVSYAPSNAPMKGAPSIDEELATLDREGVIEYRRAPRVRASEMPDVYRGADIVLDQFRLGDYGVAACEAMAAGRIVVGHVSDEVRANVRGLTGLELPIVESRLSDVGAVVRAIADDPERFRPRGAEGVRFVEAVHDGRRSAAVLAPFLGIAEAEVIP